VFSPEQRTFSRQRRPSASDSVIVIAAPIGFVVSPGDRPFADRRAQARPDGVVSSIEQQIVRAIRAWIEARKARNEKGFLLRTKMGTMRAGL
jgi:hypothetical protein